MSSDLFSCPAPTELAAAPDPSCPVKFDQVVKMLIRRITGRATVTTATIIQSATITPLLSASDDTKILVSPYVLNMQFPVTEALKEGGNDNTTINGIPRLLGAGVTQIAGGYMENVEFSTANAMRALASESGIIAGFTDLEAFFVTKDGKLIADNPSTTVCYGFPIYNFFVGDVSSEGFNRPNRFPISFDLAPLWSRTATILTPTDYNPLTLQNS